MLGLLEAAVDLFDVQVLYGIICWVQQSVFGTVLLDRATPSTVSLSATSWADWKTISNST